MRTIENLRDDVVRLLQDRDDVHAAWLSGSYGRGDADEFSDMDIVAFVGRNDIAAVFSEFQKIMMDMPSLVFVKTIERGHVINMIDQNWNRIDVSFIAEDGLKNIVQDNIVMLFDKTGVTAKIPETLPGQHVHVDDIVNATQEFLRILGLLPVVIGRQDYVTGATGGQLLKNELITLWRVQNGTTQRGVLSFKKSVSSDQYALLENCPVLEHTKKSVIDYHLYLTDLFIPLARGMYDQYQLTWPDRFAQAALRRLNGAAGREYPYK